jgi:inner membrane protein
VKILIFFGHLGLTAGAFKLYEAAAAKYAKKPVPEIDYRFVLVGSVLPDLIDKPIGALLFINTYHNSRIYAHTLLFTLILLIIGVCRFKKRKRSSILVLGTASLAHLLLDSMWRYPETLLWPFWNIRSALSAKAAWLSTLLGFPYRFDNWLEQNMLSILKNPTPLLFELAGIAILAVLFIRLIRKKQIPQFFKSGKL